MEAYCEYLRGNKKKHDRLFASKKISISWEVRSYRFFEEDLEFVFDAFNRP